MRQRACNNVQEPMLVPPHLTARDSALWRHGPLRLPIPFPARRQEHKRGPATRGRLLYCCTLSLARALATGLFCFFLLFHNLCFFFYFQRHSTPALSANGDAGIFGLVHIALALLQSRPSLCGPLSSHAATGGTTTSLPNVAASGHHAIFLRSLRPLFNSLL